MVPAAFVKKICNNISINIDKRENLLYYFICFLYNDMGAKYLICYL
jgi:hypothetical protein